MNFLCAFQYELKPVWRYENKLNGHIWCHYHTTRTNRGYPFIHYAWYSSRGSFKAYCIKLMWETIVMHKTVPEHQLTVTDKYSAFRKTQTMNPSPCGLSRSANNLSLLWRHNEPMASQITGVSIFCSTVGSTADQRKYQSPVPLAFVRGPGNSPHKEPVMRKMFPFDDVIMARPCDWEHCDNKILRKRFYSWI